MNKTHERHRKLIHKKHIETRKRKIKKVRKKKKLGLLARLLAWLRRETIVKPKHRRRKRRHIIKKKKHKKRIVRKKPKKKRGIKKKKVRKVRKKRKIRGAVKKRGLKKRLERLKKERERLKKKREKLKRKAILAKKKKLAKLKAKKSKFVRKPKIVVQPKAILKPKIAQKGVGKISKERITAPTITKIKPAIPKITAKKVELREMEKERRRIIKIKESLEERVKKKRAWKPKFEQEWQRLKRDVIKSKKLTEEQKEKLLGEIEKLRAKRAIEEKPKVLEIKKPKRKSIITLPEAGKGIIIQTELDQIMELLNKKRKVKLKDLAIRFKRDESIIEEWANILHDEGLIELVYPFTGGPFIRLKKVKKIGEKAKKKKS